TRDVRRPGSSSARAFASSTAGPFTCCRATCGRESRRAARSRPGRASPTIAWTLPSRASPVSAAWRPRGRWSPTASPSAPASSHPPPRPGRRAMPPPVIRHAHTDTLEIGYEEHGRLAAPVTMLLHGFPDDARSWDDVVPPLVAAGHRVIVPYLRGYGPTRFHDPRARMAQQAALGQDLFDLMNALSLDRVAVVGQDWGSRAACVLSALHPERVRALVTLGGYPIRKIAEMARPEEPEQEARLWYQWYFNTERGRAGLTANRREICRVLWRTWSPGWRFDDATLDRTAASLDNPDFVDVVIHSYRH